MNKSGVYSGLIINGNYCEIKISKDWKFIKDFEDYLYQEGMVPKDHEIFVLIRGKLREKTASIESIKGLTLISVATTKKKK